MCTVPTPDDGRPGLPEHVAGHCVSFVTLWCVQSWLDGLKLTSCAVHTLLSWDSIVYRSVFQQSVRRKANGLNF